MLDLGSITAASRWAGSQHGGCMTKRSPFDGTSFLAIDPELPKD
jgi:hypothetical protein